MGTYAQEKLSANSQLEAIPRFSDEFFREFSLGNSKSRNFLSGKSFLFDEQSLILLAKSSQLLGSRPFTKLIERLEAG